MDTFIKQTLVIRRILKHLDLWEDPNSYCFMASVMSSDTLGIFTLLQRFFILYIPVILGTVVVFKEADSSLKQKLPPA